MVQCRDLIQATVLLGCSELYLLLNSLVDGCGPGRERGGLPHHSSVAQPSMNTEPCLMASSAAEMESSGLGLP